MIEAYIALGSNQGVSSDLLQQALEQISLLPSTQLITTSRWYRSAPVGGPANQPDYLNAVCKIETGLAPSDLLMALQRIEQDHGRVRKERWGPRTLDLDIIIYDGLHQEDPDLTLPHPRAHERAFVLLPLADLDPNLELHGRTVASWLRTVPDQEIRAVSC